jgi:uncharacterized membrane protein
MAKDVGSTLASMLGTIAREVTDSVSVDGHRNGHGPFGKDKAGALKGARGVAAGAALATAVPLAGKAAKRLVVKGAEASPVEAVKDAGEDIAQKVGKGATDTIGEKAGGAPGLAKEVGKKMVPGLGGKEGDSKEGKEVPGVGKGRRMPVQQAVDVGVPLSVAYNQWTQFEEWPQFMHRLDQVTQEDDCTVSFRTKIWGMSKEFVAEIEEQRPDERIKWSVAEGVVHTGVVTFHELAPKLTRVQVTLDVEPGSLLEKAGRGMRFVKRAVRADLARFKAFIEVSEEETGAWRGVIHEGELVKRKEEKARKSSPRKSSSGSSSSNGSRGQKKRSRSGGRSRSRSGSSRKKSSSARR